MSHYVNALWRNQLTNKLKFPKNSFTKLLLLQNVFGQMVQKYGFKPLWTLIWNAIFDFLNNFWHMVHLSIKLLLCLLKCEMKFRLDLIIIEHLSHWYEFSWSDGGCDVSSEVARFSSSSSFTWNWDIYLSLLLTEFNVKRCYAGLAATSAEHFIVIYLYLL